MDQRLLRYWATQVPIFVTGNKTKEPEVITEEMAEELCEKHEEKCYSAFIDAKHAPGLEYQPTNGRNFENSEGKCFAQSGK